MIRKEACVTPDCELRGKPFPADEGSDRCLCGGLTFEIDIANAMIRKADEAIENGRKKKR